MFISVLFLLLMCAVALWSFDVMCAAHLMVRGVSRYYKDSYFAANKDKCLGAIDLSLVEVTGKTQILVETATTPVQPIGLRHCGGITARFLVDGPALVLHRPVRHQRSQRKGHLHASRIARL